jgi:hypothetical protein
MAEPKKIAWGLLRRRECVVPTRRGCLVLFLGFALAAGIFLLGINPFLSITKKVPGGVLVVEGWAPDYALEAAAAEFKQGSYGKLYVTGGPIDQGAPLSEYKTYADLGAAALVKLGLPAGSVQAIPAPWVRQDRTYMSARSLTQWWSGHETGPLSKVNLLTVGPHARRSRLLFEKALGGGVEVGVISIPGRDYETVSWWRSSSGVRTVVGETIGYLYARLLFHPSGN